MKDGYNEKNLIATLKYSGMFVMLWNDSPPKGHGIFARVHGIMDSIKYKDILNLNIAVSARKLKLAHHWISVGQ